MLNSLAVTKWLEPYVILETFKKYFECQDITFDGFSKKTKQQEFYSKLEKSEDYAVGLYLKNVNKFYVMTSKTDINIEKNILIDEFALAETDICPVESADKAVEMVDMAKAEVIILIKK